MLGLLVIMVQCEHKYMHKASTGIYSLQLQSLFYKLLRLQLVMQLHCMTNFR